MTTATIFFEPGSFDFAVDRLSALLDAKGFPVLEADLEEGTVTVEAESDPDEYSVLMAAAEAGAVVGLREDELLHALLS